MKNQRFLFPDQQRTAEDDPLGPLPEGNPWLYSTKSDYFQF